SYTHPFRSRVDEGPVDDLDPRQHAFRTREFPKPEIASRSALPFIEIAGFAMTDDNLLEPDPADDEMAENLEIGRGIGEHGIGIVMRRQPCGHVEQFCECPVDICAMLCRF